MHGHSHHGHSHSHGSPGDHHGDSRNHPSHDTCVIDSPLLESPHSPSSPRPTPNSPPSSFKTIKPFRNTSALKAFVDELLRLSRRREAVTLLFMGLLNIVAVFLLIYWCHSTHSMSLSAYTYLTAFDSFALLTCMISLWVQRRRPSPFFSFGYERFEVLAVFSATILAQLGALFSIKESIERLFEKEHVVIHSGFMIFGAVVAFCLHLLVTYWHCASYPLFNHIIDAASSSWLQEQVADLSQSLCHLIPGLSRLLLPRLNPLILIGWAGFGFILLSDALLDLDNSHSVDTWAAIVFSVMFFGTMFPMSTYAGKILLQTIPTHVIAQLDKCLREASTLDGVLEFRHEHFWTVSFGKLAGSVHVRIRRDANEQMVLAHVHDRLSSVVSILTIQAFKDDWASRVGASSSRHFGGANLSGANLSSANLSGAKPPTPNSSFQIFGNSPFTPKVHPGGGAGFSRETTPSNLSYNSVSSRIPSLDPWTGSTSTPLKKDQLTLDPRVAVPQMSPAGGQWGQGGVGGVGGVAGVAGVAGPNRESHFQAIYPTGAATFGSLSPINSLYRS